MDIRCRKTSCKHNNKLSCMADGILVDDKIICTKFVGVPNKHYDISKHIFEETPKIANYRHNKKLSIKCNAKCLFNRSSICIANGITVNDITNKPKCITFSKP